jgi:hypothetical protein
MSEMCISIETTSLSVIQTAWNQTFCSNDPFSWPFRSSIAAGCIFYPTDGYHLTEQQFSTVVEAVKQIGETSFFLSIVESEGLSFLDRDWGHWKCTNPTYEEYCQLPLTLENSIYSTVGKWGILISHEMHALIAGSIEFITLIAKQYGELEDDLYLLRKSWAGNMNRNWVDEIIPRLIDHLD